MLRRIAAFAGPTLASRLLGFVRDILTAAVLGAGPVADAFVVAFRLPNHFRALFAEGAFNAAFVPLFAKSVVADGLAAALRFAGQILAVLLAVQFVLLVAAELAMPAVIRALAPGFADDPLRFDLAVLFTRITFPYLLFISVVALLGGVLNSLDRFAATAAAPILLNLCLIAALLGLAPLMETPGHALAWGVLAAGIAQFLYLAWACHQAGADLRLPRPRLSPAVRRFFVVLGPATLGAGVTEISLFVDTMIVSTLPQGAPSHLYYADRLYQLPLGVIGIAIGTVLLPELSRHLKAGDDRAAASSQNRAIELSLLLTLPAAALFLAAALPIVRALFEHGRFTAADAEGSARVLMAYALGLPAIVVVRSLLPGFYAREDTRTPVRISLAVIATGIVLKLLLKGPLLAAGVALGTSIAAWLNVVLLAGVLRRRGHLTVDPRLRRALPRLAVAGVAMTLAVAGTHWLLGPWLHDGSALVRLAALAVLGLAGTAVYGAAAWLTGAVRRDDLARLLRRGRPPPLGR